MENALNLNKFQIAAARRAYQSEKMSIRQLRKVEAKLEKLMEEKAALMVGIDAFDAPIKAFTGGLGAEETLRVLGILKDENNEQEVAEPITESLDNEGTEPVEVLTDAASTGEMPEWMKIAEEELK